jgi:pyruvate formate lyase activating enzyme
LLSEEERTLGMSEQKSKREENPKERVNLGGMVPLSTVDWTGVAAAVIFLRGCPLRCPHCHNWQLQTGKSWESLSNLKRDIREAAPFVSAVVLTGGEPMVQPRAARRIAEFAKEEGLQVGVETSGYYPDRLSQLVEDGLVDQVFLDVKAVLRDPPYAQATGRKDVAPQVRESLERCARLGVPLEVRTTIFPKMLPRQVPAGSAPSPEEVREIAQALADVKSRYPENQLHLLALQQGVHSNGEKPFQPVSMKTLTELSQLIRDLIEVEVKKGPVSKLGSFYQTDLRELSQLCRLHQLVEKKRPQDRTLESIDDR